MASFVRRPNVSGELRARYILRRDNGTKMSYTQICDGDSRDIAYENLLYLLEHSDEGNKASGLLERINLKGRPVHDHLSFDNLYKRSKQAFTYFAKVAKIPNYQLEFMINHARARNGLPELLPSWIFDNTTAVPGRVAFREELSGNPDLVKTLQATTPPWRRTYAAKPKVTQVLTASSKPQAAFKRALADIEAQEAELEAAVARDEAEDEEADKARPLKRPRARTIRPEPSCQADLGMGYAMAEADFQKYLEDSDDLFGVKK